MVTNASLSLLYAFTAREINSRYKGSVLGVAWNLLTPIALLLVYAFVFTNVFKTRIADVGTDHYIVFLALALWPWMMFADGLMRGMSAITGNASLIKKTALPHFILVLAAVSANFVVHIAGFVVVIVILAVSMGGIYWSGAPGMLVLLLGLFLITLGIAAILAALQTIVRDVEQFVAPVLMMVHFLTPVLYPATLIPEPYRDWLSWNPLAVIVTRMRGHLLATVQIGAPEGWILLVGVIVLGFGYLFFSRLSPHLEDFV